MDRFAHNSQQNLPDVSAFLESLAAEREFFAGTDDIYVARAPGRLDVMGGIADYSGALVLEMPIAEAAFVALQKCDERSLKIISRGATENRPTQFFEMPLAEFGRDDKPISYAEAQDKFKRDAANGWAAYIAGALLVLRREKDFRFALGARILLDSSVPEGKGVSSSAAIEVATMSALAAAFGIELEAREVALLCQKVENLIVGAPCGIMDQLSSACGAENQLLALLCQPAELRGTFEIPDDLAVWGIDSGIRHSVGAGDYGSVRTGAFMGYRIIAELAGCRVEPTETDGVVRVEARRWYGYLANISPAEFEQNHLAHLPREISGAEFLARYGGITDVVTRVLPGRNYAILNPTAHPIYENFRVRRFAELLAAPIDEDRRVELGKLMYASHESYSACGLGSDGTDRLVALVKHSGAPLYGAKITGGGSGGTVAILGARGADAEIKNIAEAYAEQTSYHPYIFSGSSPGAAAFGVLRLPREAI